GAPPFQMFVLPQRLPKMTLVGTMAIFFAGVNAMKLAPYLALGQFSTATLATSAVLLPVAVATNFLGIWLVRATPIALFYRLAYWLVFVLSLALFGQGAMGLLWFAHPLWPAKGSEGAPWRRRPTTPISTATRRISSR